MNVKYLTWICVVGQWIAMINYNPIAWLICTLGAAIGLFVWWRDLHQAPKRP